MQTAIVEIIASDYLEEAAPLLAAHWHEVALNKDVMVLKPDINKYRLLEASNMLFTLGAFVDGNLVGYSVNLIGPNLHYADLTYVNNDLLFVAPEHRRSRIGIDLIRATEQMAAERGARLILWHAKENTALATLLPRLGYGVQDIIFSKVL